jgi:hypothetical protein
MKRHTTIACQKSGWTIHYEADEQFVNCISLINNSAANAAPSASSGRCAFFSKSLLKKLEK